MSTEELEFCLLTVEERLSGKHRMVAGQIADMYNGVTLGHLVRINHPELPPNNVKEILAELLFHGFVEYDSASKQEEDGGDSKTHYHLAVECILSQLWHIHFSQYAGVKYGPAAKVIVVHLLKFACFSVKSLFQHLIQTAGLELEAVIHGFRSLCIDRVVVYHKNWTSELVERLEEYVVDDDDVADRLKFIHIEESSLQELRREFSSTEFTQSPQITPRKRKFSELHVAAEETIPLSNRLICINHNVLTILLQNELIKELATICFDDISATVIATMLEHVQENRAMNATQSFAIPFYQLLRSITTHNISEDDLKAYLQMLSGDDCNNIVTVVDDRGAGEFAVNIEAAFRRYVEIALHTLITHKYGPVAARICKMVLFKKYMDPKQISQLCLIDYNETQILLQKLIKDEFLHINLIPRGIENRPLKSICIVNTTIDKISSLLQTQCIKFIINLLAHRKSLVEKNKVLLDKGEQLQKIFAAEQNNSKLSGHSSLLLEATQTVDTLTETEKANLSFLDIKLKKIDLTVAKLSKQYFVIKYFLVISRTSP